MRSIVPGYIARQSLSSSSASGPSEVEKMASKRKAMMEHPDKEVSYYDNPTILSRLVQGQKFSAALERLEKKGPAEASIWVCTKRQVESNRSQHEDGSTSLISGLTQSCSIYQVAYKEEYTFRALPIHMACSCLGRTVDKGLWADLEKLIAYLAIVYPQGCARRDHEGRMPLHEAIWYNASPCTVSALLMAAPEAVNEQDIHGRYPIALNEHRTGEHKEAVRKLLRLKRKYWDMARQEATLRFKHRNVPSADESITSTSVLAASLADEETLFTTATAFPLAASGDENPNDARRILYKATNVTQTGHEPIQPMSWSQLEKRAMLAERKLEQVNEVNYILSKQVIEFRAAQKELQEKLDRYTKTDLGRQVKRIETEKEDLAWQVQRLHGILLRNGIALDPDEASFISSTPPREVKVGEEQQNVNNKPSNDIDRSISVVILQQQQQEQIVRLQQQVKSLKDENEEYKIQLAAAAATTHKPPILETNESLGSLVHNQPLQAAAAAPDDKDACHDDDDDEYENENDQDGNSYACSHYSFGNGSEQSTLEYDMQVLEEMNERVRQLVISESASNYQGQSLYPQFAARPVQQQQQQQERSCLKEPPPASSVADCHGNSMSQQVCGLKEDEMDKKPPAKPTVISKNDPSQSVEANDESKKNITIHKKQQATTVAAFDVTYINDSQVSFPISTIEEEEDEEEKEKEGIESVPEPSGASSSGGASGNSHDGSSIASAGQGESQNKNADTVSCNNNQEEMNDAEMDDDLDSVLAEAVKLNGGKGLSPDILRLWRETTAVTYGLSAISLPSMLEEELQQQQDLNGSKGISPEMLRLWRETSATSLGLSAVSLPSFGLSSVSLPSMFEQQQQQHQDDETSACSSSTDAHENKSTSRKKKSPPTAGPCLVGAENVGTTMGTTSYQYPNNVKSNNGDCSNNDKAPAAPGASGHQVVASSSTTKPCSFFSTATSKTPTSLDDMSLCSDDMSELFSQAAKVYPRGHGGDGAASTCSKDVSI